MRIYIYICRCTDRDRERGLCDKAEALAYEVQNFFNDPSGPPSEQSRSRLPRNPEISAIFIAEVLEASCLRYPRYHAKHPPSYLLDPVTDCSGFA